MLTLSDRDVAAFTGLQRALLSPLRHACADDWCRAVLRCAESLFHAHGSAMLVSVAGRVHSVSESIGRDMLTALERTASDLTPGAQRIAHPGPGLELNRGRPCSFDVWIAGKGREATLGVASSTPEFGRFDEQAALELMQMVLPSLDAGVRELVCAAEHRVALAKALDGLGEPLLVCDAAVRELYRSRRLDEMLSADPERDFVLGEMQALGESLVSGRTDRADDRPSPIGSVEVVTAAARYRARGSCAAAGLLDREGVVLVALQKVSQDLPSAAQLATRHGLTPREAQVAVLLARGLSNREIAERLSLSRSTVRHHAEWVFTKLGVHSRKALGLTLIGRGDEPIA